MNQIKKLSITLAASAAIGFAASVHATPVKIFILAGQSNMLGHGEISPAKTPGTLEHTVANDPNGDYRFLVDGTGNWVVRDDVWIRDQKPAQGGLTVGFGSTAKTIGPEVGFGHLIGDLNEEQVLIVKAAWGGKSLAVDFRPPSSGSRADPSIPYDTPTAAGDEGFYYQQILRLVNEATTNLGTYFPDYAGQGYEIAGFGWHQGYNDRVNAVAGASAAYEANMVNFIKDIRSSENGLGVPNLPFVIATTGMGGGTTYSEVELAQLAMADATAYPEFAGNLRVIDTRFPYDGLEFWQPAQLSPKDQGFHWNRNAKTYLNIGLAMGDAMSLLIPRRCPFRPRAVSGPSGITLSWENGTEMPTSVRILRNGTEIAAVASTNPPSFLDTTAEPGVHNYEFRFTMPGDACDPLNVSLNGGITGLAIRPDASGIQLTWTNNMPYDAIEVRRNGVVLAGALSGTATSYTDAPAPDSGVVTYSVVPTNGSSTPATATANFNLVGELGVMKPLLVNGGINPATGLKWAAGDTYRLIGTTVDITTAPRADSSADIATYNTWVNSQAASYSTADKRWSDAAWFVVGSTPTVNARENTGTNNLSGDAGVPILKFDGTSLVAINNADLWDTAIATPINISFDGTAPSSTAVNTGTDNKGLQSGNGTLGDGDPNGDGKLRVGYTDKTNQSWIAGFPGGYEARLYYAMSEVLTVQERTAGSGYDDWVAGPWDGTLTDPNPDLDFDGGGLKTAIEWVVGGDPTLARDDASVAPILDNSDPAFVTFTYRISDAASADANTTVYAEYSSDLMSWSRAVDNDDTIEITTNDGTGDDEGFNLVTVRMDHSLAVGDKLFARLSVSVD